MSASEMLVIFTVISLIVVNKANSELDYSELTQLDASCTPYDTCAVPREEHEDSILINRCECKRSCVKFNTCCIDSPNNNLELSSSYKKENRGSCERVFKSNITTFIVSRCDPSWSGSDIFEAKCERPFEDFKDLVSLKPVTSLKTETTYRNYFCAFCNNDAKSIQFWDVSVSDSKGVYSQESQWDRDKADFADDLVFIESTNEWGLITEDENGNMAFVNMKINVNLPSRLNNIVPACVKELVSDCHNDWVDDVLRQKCHSYMAVVYLLQKSKSSPIAYRNVHCAICNFESYSQGTICEFYDKKPLAGKPPMSFTLLLDVNLSDGDQVGDENFPCEQGYIYDSIFKKCRKLVCALPGHTLKGGKCVPS